MKQNNGNSAPHGNGGGSKFLPGGGNGGFKGQAVHSQTSRSMHTNQSHSGGAKGR